MGKSPNTATIHFPLADTAMRAGRYDLALDHYQQPQIMTPGSPEVYMRLGTLYRLKGDSSKAIASFQAAKELAPRSPLVEGALGDAFRAAGRNAEAMASYRRALALDPQNAILMNNLAYSLLDMGGAQDEARKRGAGPETSPQNPNFADTVGMVYLKKNLDASALQVFSGLTQRFPDNPVFRYHYALTLTQEGQKAKAKTELQLALRKNPPDDLRRNIQASLAKIQQ
jgi:tetratricopeptide (TPR) repeat protein